MRVTILLRAGCGPSGPRRDFPPEEVPHTPRRAAGRPGSLSLFGVSTLAIVLLAVGALLLLLFAGGFLGARRRAAAGEEELRRHLAAADQALEAARAADKGWDRVLLEEAARRALAEQQPGFDYDELHLVLVDDRPGTDADRAHFVARSRDGERRVVLARQGDAWIADAAA